MNRSILRAAPLALLTFLCACTEAPPPAPPDTRAADEKAIRDDVAQMLKDAQAKDADKAATHYAEDASFLVPDQPPQTGKAAIGAAWKAMLDMTDSIDFSASKVEVSKTGDLGYAQGPYTWTYTDPKTKKKMTETGKALTVYKKQADGSWKAIEDMFNSDAPAKPAGK